MSKQCSYQEIISFSSMKVNFVEQEKHQVNLTTFCRNVPRKATPFRCFSRRRSWSDCVKSSSDWRRRMSSSLDNSRPGGFGSRWTQDIGVWTWNIIEQNWSQFHDNFVEDLKTVIDKKTGVDRKSETEKHDEAVSPDVFFNGYRWVTGYLT